MANANAQSNPSFFSLGGMLAQPSSIKLDNYNFLLWQNMILPLLRGYKLEGFLTGETSCPAQFIISTGTTSASIV